MFMCEGQMVVGSEIGEVADAMPLWALTTMLRGAWISFSMGDEVNKEF